MALAILRTGRPPARGGTLCLAGDCGNCHAEVDGVAYVRTCQTACRPGLSVVRHPEAGLPILPAVGGADVTASPTGPAIPVQRLEVDVAIVGGGRSGRTAAAEAGARPDGARPRWRGGRRDRRALPRADPRRPDAVGDGPRPGGPGDRGHRLRGGPAGLPGQRAPRPPDQPRRRTGPRRRHRARDGGRHRRRAGRGAVPGPRRSPRPVRGRRRPAPGGRDRGPRHRRRDDDPLRYGHPRSRPCPPGRPGPDGGRRRGVGHGGRLGGGHAGPAGPARGRCRLPLHGDHGRRPRGGVGPGVHRARAAQARLAGVSRAVPGRGLPAGGAVVDRSPLGHDPRPVHRPPRRSPDHDRRGRGRGRRSTPGGGPRSTTSTSRWAGGWIGSAGGGGRGTTATRWPSTGPSGRASRSAT